jgi:hypothetical protein
MKTGPLWPVPETALWSGGRWDLRPIRAGRTATPWSPAAPATLQSYTYRTNCGGLASRPRTTHRGVSPRNEVRVSKGPGDLGDASAGGAQVAVLGEVTSPGKVTHIPECPHSSRSPS